MIRRPPRSTLFPYRRSSDLLRLTTGFLDNTLNPTVLFVINTNRADYRVSPRIDYLLSGAVTKSTVGLSRSEEHTSELQSQSNLVCRLLLEKNNNIKSEKTNT